jgi:predicted ATPase
LSLIGQLKLLRRIHDVVGGNGQFLVATHSPILLAYPGARIYEFSAAGLDEVAYDVAQPYVLTKSFLDDPNAFLHHLFTDEPEDLT